MPNVRPSTEISSISWSIVGGTNYATVLSDESDATYVSAPSMVGAQAIVGLPAVTDPGIDAGWELRVRGRYVGDTDVATISLYELNDLIDGDTVNFTSSFAEYSIALDPAAIALITDFSDLRIWVRKEALGSGGLDVSDVWLVVPGTGGGNVTVIGGAVQCVGIAPLISAISGGTVTVTGVDKADDPVSFADAVYGQVCSASGLWYPARRIVIVNGRPYGDDMAFKDQEPPRGDVV